MDLARYTLPQLKQLATRIAAEIEKRRSGDKASLRKRLEHLARAHGVALEDVLKEAEPIRRRRAGAKPAATPKAPPSPKYIHPSNRALAWSGRGRRPQWVDAWLAHGGTLDALEVAAQKLARKTFAPSGTVRSTTVHASPAAGEDLNVCPEEPEGAHP